MCVCVCTRIRVILDLHLCPLMRSSHLGRLPSHFCPDGRTGRTSDATGTVGTYRGHRLERWLQGVAN